MTEIDPQAVRLQHINARKARHARRMPIVAPVRVVPRDEDVRLHIKHPISNIAFPEKGSVEWPHDGFTQRRIADGTVTLADEPQEAKEAKEAKPAPNR